MNRTFIGEYVAVFLLKLKVNNHQWVTQSYTTTHKFIGNDWCKMVDIGWNVEKFFEKKLLPVK